MVLGLAEAGGRVSSPAPASPAAPSFSDQQLGSPSWSLSASEGSLRASGRMDFLVVAPLVLLGFSGQGLWLQLTLGLCLEVEEALRAFLCPSFFRWLLLLLAKYCYWWLGTQRSNALREVILWLLCSLLGFWCEGSIYSISSC